MHMFFFDAIFFDAKYQEKKMICINKKYPADHQKENIFASKKIFQGTRALMLQGVCSILKNLAGHQKEN